MWLWKKELRNIICDEPGRKMEGGSEIMIYCCNSLSPRVQKGTETGNIVVNSSKKIPRSESNVL